MDQILQGESSLNFDIPYTVTYPQSLVFLTRNLGIAYACVCLSQTAEHQTNARGFISLLSYSNPTISALVHDSPQQGLRRISISEVYAIDTF